MEIIFKHGNFFCYGEHYYCLFSYHDTKEFEIMHKAVDGILQSHPTGKDADATDGKKVIPFYYQEDGNVIYGPLTEDTGIYAGITLPRRHVHSILTTLSRETKCNIRAEKESFTSDITREAFDAIKEKVNPELTDFKKQRSYPDLEKELEQLDIVGAIELECELEILRQDLDERNQRIPAESSDIQAKERINPKRDAISQFLTQCRVNLLQQEFKTNIATIDFLQSCGPIIEQSVMQKLESFPVPEMFYSFFDTKVDELYIDLAYAEDKRDTYKTTHHKYFWTEEMEEKEQRELFKPVRDLETTIEIHERYQRKFQKLKK